LLFANLEPERSGEGQTGGSGEARAIESRVNKEKHDLLDIVAVRQDVIPEDAAAIPSLLNELA
jgi:hypothetical protein